MTARVLTLIAAAAAFWLVAGLPARHLGGGDHALLLAGVAVLLSLVPGVLTLLWAGRASNTPQQELLAWLGATGVRMFGVLLAALGLSMGTETFRGQAFLLWVAGAYLFLLAVEVLLLVRAQQMKQKTSPGA